MELPTLSQHVLNLTSPPKSWLTSNSFPPACSSILDAPAHLVDKVYPTDSARAEALQLMCPPNERKCNILAKSVPLGLNTDTLHG